MRETCQINSTSVMPKFSRIAGPRPNVVILALVLSVCFTAPVMYLSGLFCRTSPYSVAAAVKELEARKESQFIAYNPSNTAASPTPTTSTTTSTKRSFSKYDIMNDVAEGDDHKSVSLDTENDILFRNNSTTSNLPPVDLDEQSLIYNVTIGTRSDWLTVNAYHKYCQIMNDNPLQAPIPLCLRSPLSMGCSDGELKGKTPFFSRQGQDYYIYVNHFKFLKNRLFGFYIDVGTRHPVVGSYTYFMDTCLRWKGICIEGNSDVYQYIYRQRSCELTPTCITQYDMQKVLFVSKSPYASILNHPYIPEALNNSIYSTNKTLNNSVMKSRLTSTNLATIGKRSNIRLVDFLSVTVDGMEEDILKGLDFDNMLVNVILVTTTNQTLPAVERFLIGQGYVRHIPELNEESKQTGLLGRDAIFLHHDVKWGNPV